MKKIYFLLASILLVGALSSDLFAQDGNKPVIEKLQEYNWSESVTETSKLVYEFTSKKDLKITFSFQINKKTETHTETTFYYLSNTIDQKFDENQIGKNQDGNYLIYKGKDGNPVIIKIVEISSKGLKYENLKFKMLKTMYPVSK